MHTSTKSLNQSVLPQTTMEQPNSGNTYNLLDRADPNAEADIIEPDDAEADVTGPDDEKNIPTHNNVLDNQEQSANTTQEHMSSARETVHEEPEISRYGQIIRPTTRMIISCEEARTGNNKT